MARRADKAGNWERPGIIVTCADDSDEFKWMSGGWYSMKRRGTAEAERLMNIARTCIEEGADVPDVIRRLTDAGFEITRWSESEVEAFIDGDNESAGGGGGDH